MFSVLHHRVAFSAGSPSGQQEKSAKFSHLLNDQHVPFFFFYIITIVFITKAAQINVKRQGSLI